MATTQVRASSQVMDSSITLAKLVDNFLQGQTWTVSSDNSAVITGLASPTNSNDVATKEYVDGLVDTSMKSPDGYATDAAGNYPSDYKGTGTVSEGDTFYITSVANGTTVGTQTVNVGDMLIALVDNPGNTDSNWAIIESNRDLATTDVPGVIEIATQTEVDTGTDTQRAVTPATLAGYISNQGINKTAGDGMVEDGSHAFNVQAADASIIVNADDIQVGIGTTNGTSLEVTGTGLELVSNITGNRTFSGGTFSVSAGGNTITFTSTSTITLDASSNDARLANHPDGTVPLAIATTQYVDNAISSSAPNKVFNEMPTVTNGSANVTLANTPNSGTERVYLNGIRQAPGASNDYTISGNTITFSSALVTGDIVVVDYEY